jgi:hypothetical protein
VNNIQIPYNLKNVKVANATKNPYETKIPGTTLLDPGLYKSSLGTWVFSDLTLGDKVNLENNKWTDNKGIVHSFNPMTFYALLFNVTRANKIVRTEIQGRDGTVKEYIGKDDYKVLINGVITGPNGHYPIDEVNQLKKILDAPIPLIVTSWYLQNLDIDMLVIDDYELNQEAYSYQQFSINTSSDEPVELKISNA